MRNIIAGKSSGFCGVLRRYVPQNIVAITGNVRLNRFTLLYVFNWYIFAVVKMWSRVALHKYLRYQVSTVTCSFYVRTCVKFAFANKIKAMYERPHVQLFKRKSRNSLNLTFNLNTLCLTSILFTWLKFTYVNVRSQKRISGNPP